MNLRVSESALDEIIPGVAQAYAKLRSQTGHGLYTSRGRFYNKTIFGRDAAMAAKFVVDMDHHAVIETIATLVSFQGTAYNSKTQEEPGRIHHEWRDFKLWHGTFFDKIPFWLLHNKWDIRNKKLLSYYSLDSTALFIRLVHKYATHVDAAVLERPMKDHNGNVILLRDALEAAAEWIMSKVDDDGLMAEYRYKWSLPVQTFQDSLYTRKNGTLANSSRRIAYVEVQAFAADALFDMAHLLPSHEKYREWRETALRMHSTMMRRFNWDNGFLAPAIDQSGIIDVANVSAGWVLNTFILHETDAAQRKDLIVPIVKRLFSEEFLTPVGLRTRTREQPNPVPGALDYHGSETVWPMFTFMVVEGLRRHRLYRLAEQLENRLINGFNATGLFQEFYIVLRDGRLVLPSKERRRRAVNVQMKPESFIGFSVVPAMVLAHRKAYPPELSPPSPWQRELEESVLDRIDIVDATEPTRALQAVGTVEYRRLRRWVAGAKIIHFVWRERKKVSSK